MKIPPEKLQLGMIENIEYPKDNFDFITFGAVLEHLYDPSAAIKKAMNWLKPVA
jgi:2-polyprenyl-3-methyl-5-hydroxy-6-metoxy-1,4-benzoquinol methylase